MSDAFGSTEFNESQATLIDATPLIIKFNKRSVTNVTLYSSGCPMYKIVTSKDGTKTDVFDVIGTETRIATIKRREFFPDVIKYRNRASPGDVVKINNWLKHEKLDDGMPGISFDAACGQMTWRYGQSQPHRLSLYKSKDFNEPVAYLDDTASSAPLRLVINPGYQDIVEDVLMGALVLEYKLKMFERMKKHDLLYGPLLGSLISLR